MPSLSPVTSLRAGLALAVLSGCVAVIALDTTIVNVALPRLAEDLGASTAELQWVVDAYSLLFAGTLLTAGALGDRIGRRRILLAGLAVFALASVAAALAPGAGALIAARAVMGIGAAAIMPSTLSLLTQVFPDPTRRARAIGVWAAVAGAAVGLGPVLGGALLERFDWHAIFTVNPIAILPLALAALTVIPESANPARPRLDPLGAVLSTGGLVAVVYAIVAAPDAGLSAGVATSTIAGVGLLLGFVWWERRSPAPLLPLSFFSSRTFSVSIVAVGVVYLALMGSMFLLPQFLQLVWGADPLTSGLGVLPLAGGLLVASVASARVGQRYGVRNVMVAGMAAVAAGLGAVSFVSPGAPYVALGVPLAVVGVGLGLALPLATNGVLGSVPRERSGVAAAANDAVSELGGALGVAVLGGVVASRYRGRIADAITDAGPAAAALPPEVLNAVRESLAAGVVAARTASGTLGQPVTDAITTTAGVAFTSGMGRALWAGALLVGGSAVVVWRTLPRHVEHAPPG